MINPRELRIGNYLNGYSSIRGINPFAIKAINISQLQDEVDGIFNENCPKMIDNVQPIPLTEEWLIKFGFEKYGLIENKTALPNGGDNGFDGAIEFMDKWYNSILHYDNKWFYIIDQNTDDYGMNYTAKEIKYVHRFQNLFYEIKDEELELKEEIKK